MEMRILNQREQYVIENLIRKGVSDAIHGLSRMIDKNIHLSDINIKTIAAKDVAAALGGPDTTIIGVYLAFSGPANGHIVLAHHPSVAFKLLDSLVGKKNTSTCDLSDLEQSALGEVGNITGTFFLNAVANALDVIIHPSPPVVLIDMAGAILDIAMADILQEGEDVFVVESTYFISEYNTKGTFLIMLNNSFFELPFMAK
jgi:chemotaxis protein CheC